jgi:hypothetical protein
MTRIWDMVGDTVTEQCRYIKVGAIAGLIYGRFIAIRYKLEVSTYIQEPLVIGKRGFVYRANG